MLLVVCLLFVVVCCLLLIVDGNKAATNTVDCYLIVTVTLEADSLWLVCVQCFLNLFGLRSRTKTTVTTMTAATTTTAVIINKQTNKTATI